MHSEQVNEIAAALAKAQGQMRNASLNRTNPHYRSKYADLASVIDAVRKPLSDNGISWSQTMEVRDGGMVLETMLVHSSGQWIKSEYPLPIGKPQEMGSAQTYAKRYSLSAIIGVAADDDDDAEGATNNGQTASTPKARVNPHVTRPEDLSDARPRHDDNGARIDFIDTSEHRVERLSKAKARPIADALNKSMRMCTNPMQLVDWGEDHAEQVASLPDDWETVFQNRYQEFLDELRAKNPEPANHLGAG